MGLMVEGQWTTQWYKPDNDGRFKRPETVFRDWIRADGDGDFRPEAGRYHLYVAYACPWANRTLIARKLKGLEDVIDVSVVHWFMGEDGWTFDDDYDGATGDRVAGREFLRDVYSSANENYTGRVTVPVLWDTHNNTIVNNESVEIVRMFDREFPEFAADDYELFPDDIADDVDAMIEANYGPINDGVYRCGFARSQEAYDEAASALFSRLDALEKLLDEQRYLCGAQLTAADICLFTTLARFDLVYHTHFKCNLRRLRDYPNLWDFTKDIYQTAGIAETIWTDHIKRHYYESHESVNPSRIVPIGPEIDYDAPHDRARFS